MNTLLQKPLLGLAALLALGGGAGIAAIASAQTVSNADTPSTTQAATSTHNGHGMHRGPGMGKGHGVMGTVSAVNGNSVTITNTDGTSYTVDASNAQVSKTSTVSISDIKVGDTVGVMGTVNGTSVTATHIMDGVPPTHQSPPAQAQ